MQLPVRFGKYELQKFLGGGMSHVYRAEDTVLGRTVAVKVLTDDGCRDEEAKKRFLLEARLSGSMLHDNIIRIHDYGELEGRPYIVMEFLVGRDLRTAIDNGLAGDLREKLDIAVQTSRALAHVHKQNIVHRDIKPENLHLDDNGRVRLMDFGIAKAANFNLTREGFALGTPYYMSPEQVLGKPVTPAADIYSFGILLYELITGIKPVMGDSVESLFYLILHQPLDLEPLHKAAVPPQLVSLIDRCTAKKPEDRIGSFDVVISELENVLRLLGADVPVGTSRAATPQPLPTVVAPTPTPTPASAEPAASGSKLPMIAIGAGLLAVMIIGVVLFLPKDKPADTPKGTVAEQPKGPEPRVQDEFGEMILIPAGTYLYGLDSQVRQLPAFYTDKTEVSVGMWNKFAQQFGKRVRDSSFDLPVTDVDMDDAAEFCAYAKKRLPTGEEWEKAARGATGRAYPWGNQPEANRGNFKGNPHLQANTLQPVESMAESATPEGLLHMAGNVWEWTRDPQRPSEEILKIFRGMKFTVEDSWTAIRGGGFDFDIRAAAAYEKSTAPAKLKGPAIGFRCVRDAPAP